VVTALLSLDRLRRSESFGAWLVGIGLNACRAQLRQGSDPVHGAQREGGRPLESEGLKGSDPVLAAEAAELAERVRAAVTELPRGQREAVTLYYLGGLSQADAAAHLGIPPGAVKTRLHKARASLRSRLQPLRERTMQ